MKTLGAKQCTYRVNLPEIVFGHLDRTIDIHIDSNIKPAGCQHQKQAFGIDGLFNAIKTFCDIGRGLQSSNYSNPVFLQIGWRLN